MTFPVLVVVVGMLLLGRVIGCCIDSVEWSIVVIIGAVVGFSRWFITLVRGDDTS